MTLGGANTPRQSEPGSNGNERVLKFPQSSGIAGASLTDCFVSYVGQSSGESCPAVELQLVYSVAPAN